MSTHDALIWLAVAAACIAVSAVLTRASYWLEDFRYYRSITPPNPMDALDEKTETFDEDWAARRIAASNEIAFQERVREWRGGAA